MAPLSLSCFIWDSGDATFQFSPLVALLSLPIYFQHLIKEREIQISKLEEEMKFYQLELVNREQNYNSLFSSNPQVGLLDPFGAKSANSIVKTGSNQSSSLSSIKNRNSTTSNHVTPGNRQLSGYTCIRLSDIGVILQ